MTIYMEKTLFEGQRIQVGSALFTVLTVSAESVTVSRRLMTGQVIVTAYRIR